MNGQQFSGKWSIDQKMWHVNQKELFTVFLAIQNLRKVLEDSTVMIQSDNKTVVAYIRNQGGTRSQILQKTVKELWLMASHSRIILTAFYLPGKIQRHSRQSIKGNPIARLASEQSDDADDLQEMGNTRVRSVRNKRVSGGEEICINGFQRSGRSVYQRIQQKVDSEAGLGVSAAIPNAESASASQLGRRNLSGCSPAMANHLLAGGSKEQECCSPFPAVEPERSFNIPSNGSSPSGAGIMALGGLEDTGWSELVVGLSSKEVDLLSAAWRGSTGKTYSSIWKGWSASCKENKVIPKNPPALQLSSFLSHLFFQKKLAFASILTQKSAIVSMAKPEKRESLSSHPLVKSILKAIGVKKAETLGGRTVGKTKIGNIEILLNWLRQNQPDESSIFQVSRHVAALLVLASGRRIHDLTLLSIEADYCVLEGDSITFWPVFGSKTDKVSYRQSGWCLKTVEESELDPVKWIQKLLDLSQSRGKTCASLKNLFITTRGESKSSHTRCDGWMVKNHLLSFGFERSSRVDAVSGSFI